MPKRPILFLPVLVSTLAAQWHATTPTTALPPRTFPAMTYDLLTGTTLLFGGNRTTAPLGAFGDTWTYDGLAWTQQTPTTSPSARAGAQLVLDLLRGRCVLYGGVSASPIGGASSSDTWEWDGTTWAQVTTTTNPGPRGRYALAFDLQRGRTVLYGGIASSLLVGALAGTWEYDGTNWAQVATATNPGPLQDAAMCYDVVRQRIVMFGGVNPILGGTDTTWLFDGLNWTAAPAPGPRPAARAQGRLLWDSLRNVSVLHGGTSMTGTLLADTWGFDGTAWTNLVGAAPPARRAFGMAFDSVRSLGVLAGGQTAAGGSGDTYEYDGALYAPFGSGCAGSAGVPVLSSLMGPRLGQSFQVTLAGLVPAMPLAAMVTGFSDTVYNSVPLPADTTPIGMPGCTLYTAIDMLDVIGAGGGTAGWSTAVPANLALLGIVFFQQGASLDPGFNPFGAVLSNAARGTLGL